MSKMRYKKSLWKETIASLEMKPVNTSFLTYMPPPYQTMTTILCK